MKLGCGKHARWIALAAAGLALAASSARAVDYTWIHNAGGSWTDPTKWSPNIVPTTDNVFIYHTNQEATQIAYNASTYSSTTHDIRMDNDGSAGFFRFGNSLNHTAGSLTARRLIFGGRPNGIGGSAQSGGSTTLTSTLELGASTTGWGLYQLSNGSLSFTGAGGGEMGLFVGYSGEGSFDHNGGSVTTASNVPLVIARNLGSTGTYNLSGSSTLTVLRDETVGAAGIGNFTQSGGTNTIGSATTNGNLLIASGAGASGTYTLSGGAMTVNGNAYLGGSASTAGGTGVLNISGGTMTATGALIVRNTGASVVNLTGGTLNVGALSTSSNPSRFNWTNGALNVSNPLTIGPAGSGEIGPNVVLNATKTLSVGGALTVNGGTVNVQSGILNAQHINLIGATLSSAGTVNSPVTLYASNGTFGTFELISVIHAAPINMISAHDLGTVLRGLGASSVTGGVVVHGIKTVSLETGWGLNDALNVLTIGDADNDYVTGLNSSVTTLIRGRGTVSLPYANNNYVGEWIIDSGTLQVGHALSFGTGNLPVGVDFGAALEINGVALSRDIDLRATLRGIGPAASHGILNVYSAANVTLATGASTLDTLRIGDGDDDLRGGGGGSTITIAGAGTVILLNTGSYSGNWTIAASTLVVESGLVVDLGEAITGAGTVGSPNSPTTPTIINGTALGNSLAQPLTFTGYVKGVGTFNNVIFTGTFDPGLSPAILTVGNLAFSSTNTLIMEVGGTAPGGGYDQIQSSGTLALDGTLLVTLINGFNPAAGNSFNLLDWAGLAGTFDTLQLPALTGSLVWDTTQLYTTGMLLVAAPGLPGDYNHDGAVDAADYVVWRKTDGTPASYTTWRANFGQTTGTGSAAIGSDIASATVPEPVTLVMLIVTAAGVPSRWRWRNRQVSKLNNA